MVIIGIVMMVIGLKGIHEDLLERELRECRDWERSAAPFGAWQIKQCNSFGIKLI